MNEPMSIDRLEEMAAHSTHKLRHAIRNRAIVREQETTAAAADGDMPHDITEFLFSIISTKLDNYRVFETVLEQMEPLPTPLPRLNHIYLLLLGVFDILGLAETPSITNTNDTSVSAMNSVLIGLSSSMLNNTIYTDIVGVSERFRNIERAIKKRSKCLDENTKTQFYKRGINILIILIAEGLYNYWLLQNVPGRRSVDITSPKKMYVAYGALFDRTLRIFKNELNLLLADIEQIAPPTQKGKCSIMGGRRFKRMTKKNSRRRKN